MDWPCFHRRSSLFLFVLILFSLFFVLSWLLASSETHYEAGNETFTKLARELKTLEHKFLTRLANWEYMFINQGETKGYDTSILQELIQKFSDVEEELSLAQPWQNSRETSASDYKIIEKVMVDFEKHISKLQTLDSLLMIKLQRKYSQGELENTLTWLRHTSLPPGKTWRSLQTNIPNGFNMVFFNDYNFHSLRQCLSSLIASVAYSFTDRSHQCLFVLGKFREKTATENVQKTLNVIKHVRFCKKIIWRLDLETIEVTGSFSTWRAVMEKIFGTSNSRGTPNTKGFFHNYKGDILFLDENVILSEDGLEVALFASLAKNTLSGIWQFALGGDGGENTVNAHPDTFIMRKSGTFLRTGYGFNASTWRVLSQLDTSSLDMENEWNINIGKMIAQGNNMEAFHVIVPTLARVHVMSKTEKIPWSLATRTIDMNLATVNKGIRDIYGFLCDPSLLVPVEEIGQAECACSSRRWNWKRSRNMYCCVQPFHVEDKCFSGKYSELD